MSGTNTLAGAVVTMEESVINFQRFTGCTIAEALLTATLNPAKVLGIEKTKGTLDHGSDGDFIILDKNSLKVQATFIDGECLVNTANLPYSSCDILARNLEEKREDIKQNNNL